MQEAERPVLMTVKEAAEYLQVSVWTIHRWANANLLDYIRILTFRSTTPSVNCG